MPLLRTLFVLLMFCLGGCSSAVQSTARPSPQIPPRSVASPAGPSQLSGRQALAPHTASPQFVAAAEQDDEQRLAQFWEQRTRKNQVDDYPLGAGDVLVISVPGMQEITNREVRISGSGTLALPLVGTLQAEGLTEEALREEIQQRLSANYMYNPQVDIFVREYRSRQVAVIGAVAKPGLYRLASEADTLLDMLSQAGGLTKEASQRIHFIPAEPVERGKALKLASTLPVQLTSQSPSPLLLKRSDPLVLDLQTLTKGTNQLYLAMPMRPGDVILVPGAGEVLIEGWVPKPGAYPANAGLTVLGAVAVAGGPMFAADTSAVRIVRTQANGKKSLFLANLQDIKQGIQEDIHVHDGDIIEVTGSTTRMVPYGVYQFFTSVFRVGGSLPLTGF